MTPSRLARTRTGRPGSLTRPTRRAGEPRGWPRRSRSRNRKRDRSRWRQLKGSVAALRDIDRKRLRGWLVLAGAALATAGVISGVIAGHDFITSSNRFAIQDISVHGNRSVSDQHVAALLGVAEGENIFRARTGAMAAELERDPWIASASVRRGLPDTLIVEVEEHRAAALVELDGLYLADRHGHVFKRAAVGRGEGEGLPVITGLARADYIRDPAMAGQTIRDALAAAALYEGDSTRPRLGEIHVHPRYGISVLTYQDAVAVRLGRGDADALRRRLTGFDTVWHELSPDERRRARTVFADGSGRVTVAFDGIE